MTDENNSEDAPRPSKKGNRAWFGGNPLQVSKQDANFVDRWIIKDDSANVERHLSLGWQLAERKREGFRGDATKDGAPLTSADTYREMVRVVLHKDDKAERDAALADMNQRQWTGIKDQAESEMSRATGGRARVRGSITIT